MNKTGPSIRTMLTYLALLPAIVVKQVFYIVRDALRKKLGR